MTDNDAAFQSTANLARMIAQGDVTSAELVEIHARRHERFHGRVNAVIQSDFDRALDQAKQADEMLAQGAEIEPLHGVPFTVIECFEVAGFRATAGAPELAHHRPTDNADAVQNLFRAGALCMGKTNIPYMAVDLQSYNDVFGVTNNPWDESRTCGGSSGGAAAALAGGLTGGDIGSDIGGSLRNPAHYCGVYSHKPTFDLISMRGHVPPMPGTASGLDLSVAGPMGRSVDDLTLLLDVLMRPAGLQKDRTLTLPPARKTQLEDFRVAIWPGHPSNRPSQAVAGRMEALTKALEGNVAALEEAWPLKASYETLMRVYARLLLSALSPSTPKAAFFAAQMVRQLSGPAKLFGLYNEKNRLGAANHTAVSHRDWILANEERAQMRMQIHAFFEAYDVLIMPVVPWTAPKHKHDGDLITRKIVVDGAERNYTDALDYIALATTLYLPATIAPIGLAEDGLPVGIQIIGPYMNDHTTIAFAGALVDLIGGYQPPPDFMDASASKSS